MIFDLAMSVPEAFRGVVDESVESIELAPRINGFHLEPRCRVCRNDQVRTKVNAVLASGASYAIVLRALGDHNAKLEQRERATIDSVRNHAVRHFPVLQVARATYREILERRARENSVDFIEGVTSAITPLAVLETIMVKGYQTLVDEGTTVSYRDGMEAALKLNEIARNDEGAIDRAWYVGRHGPHHRGGSDLHHAHPVNRLRSLLGDRGFATQPRPARFRGELLQ